jgi:hypothetical protein
MPTAFSKSGTEKFSRPTAQKPKLLLLAPPQAEQVFPRRIKFCRRQNFIRQKINQKKASKIQRLKTNQTKKLTANSYPLKANH